MVGNTHDPAWSEGEPAAIERATLWDEEGNGVISPLLVTAASLAHTATGIVMACLVYDRAANGRVHPAFFSGGLFVMLAVPVRFVFGRTEAWLAVARWLSG